MVPQDGDVATLPKHTLFRNRPPKMDGIREAVERLINRNINND
ncbi:hypothetical protein NHF46_06190 [Arthrobacter alpinus]|nr:hypothetical protein [Arthrobacter alpinus]